MILLGKCQHFGKKMFCNMIKNNNSFNQKDKQLKSDKKKYIKHCKN